MHTEGTSKISFEKILEGYPNPVWIRDREGKVIYYNKAYKQLMGERYKAIIDKKNLEHLEYEIKTQILSENGKERMIDEYIYPLYHKGERIGTRGICYDVTNSFNTTKRFEEIFNQLSEYIKGIKIDYLKIREKNIEDYIKDLYQTYFKEENIAYVFEEGQKQEVYGVNDNYKQISSHITRELAKYKKDSIKPIPIKKIKNHKIKYKLNKCNVTHVIYYPIHIGSKHIGGAIRYIYNNQIQMTSIDYNIRNSTKYIGIIRNNYIFSHEVFKAIEEKMLTDIECKIYLQNTDKLLCMIKKDRKITKLGNGWENLLGENDDEVIRGQLEDSKLIQKAIDLIACNKKASAVTTRLRCADKSYKEIVWELTYIGNEEVVFALGTKRRTKEVINNRQMLIQQEIELEKIKGKLFTSVSDQLKQPLDGLLRSAKILELYVRENKEDKESYRYLQKYTNVITQNVYRLMRLINNLIDMTEINQGNYKLMLANCDIVTYIEETIRSIQPYVEQKNITLQLEKEVDNIILACDKEKIERVILNIISNSIKYTEKSGKIIVNISRSFDYIQLSIKDTGEGIEEAFIEKVFERFMRIDSSMTRKAEGSGMGLSIVKGLIELHKGEVKIKSECGKGTEIIIKLPIYRIKENKTLYKFAQNSTMSLEMEFSDI